MGKFPSTVIVCIFFAAFAAAAKLEGRIVGGQVVNIEDYPYQISMKIDGKHNCGGTIISSRYIITANHCLDSIPAARITVRVGSSLHDSGGQLLAVEEVIVHPQWNPQTIANDIAILKLENDIIFGERVQPIPVAGYNEEVPVGTVSIVSGWGLLQENGGGIPDELHAVQVPIVDHEICKDLYKPGTSIIDGMLCAGYVGVGGKDSCSMDSGGPLVANGKLIGVVSFGRGCGDAEYPGVYTDVSFYRSFIQEHTGL